MPALAIAAWVPPGRKQLETVADERLGEGFDAGFVGDAKQRPADGLGHFAGGRGAREQTRASSLTFAKPGPNADLGDSRAPLDFSRFA